MMVKQPGHLTSMKKDRGVGTKVYHIQYISSEIFLIEGFDGCEGIVP